MLEFIDPDILALVSTFLVVIIVLTFAWKNRFFQKQLEFAKALPEETANKDFLVLVFLNSIPIVVAYFKWLIGYFIRIVWYLVIFTLIATTINDFELSFLVIFAIVSAKVSMANSSNKGKEVIILSPEENERIKKGDAKFSDFEAQK